MELSMADVEAMRPTHSGYACECGEHKMFNRLLKIAGVKPMFTYVYIKGDYDRRHLPQVSEINMWFATFDEAEEDLARHVRTYNSEGNAGFPLVVEDYVICRSTATPLYPLDRPGSHRGPLEPAPEISLTSAISRASQVLSMQDQTIEADGTRTVEVPAWVLGTLLGAARLHRRDRNDR